MHHTLVLDLAKTNMTLQLQIKWVSSKITVHTKSYTGKNKICTKMTVTLGNDLM